jgi:hypothetical protein
MRTFVMLGTLVAVAGCGGRRDAAGSTGPVGNTALGRGPAPPWRFTSETIVEVEGRSVVEWWPGDGVTWVERDGRLVRV